MSACETIRCSQSNRRELCGTVLFIIFGCTKKSEMKVKRGGNTSFDSEEKKSAVSLLDMMNEYMELVYLNWSIATISV